MTEIEALYAERTRFDVRFNDIWEHMGTLRKYAEKVATICEIGTRTGNSTVAFLAGLSAGATAERRGAMRSFDIADQQFTPPPLTNCDWAFVRADSHAEDFRVPRCELLFIDGCHKYESVKKDLKQAERCWLYLILHDTCEKRDATYGDGVVQAMNEFLKENPEWAIIERFDNCNGLTVLGRNISP